MSRRLTDAGLHDAIRRHNRGYYFGRSLEENEPCSCAGCRAERERDPRVGRLSYSQDGELSFTVDSGGLSVTSTERAEPEERSITSYIDIAVIVVCVAQLMGFLLSIPMDGCRPM